MASPSRLVCVVESEDTLRESVCRALRAENLRAEGFADGAAARAALARAMPDLAVVDLAVPDGGAICAEMRQRSDTLPIIALLARGEHAPAAGGTPPAADDYLPTPFSLKELLTRVKVLMRRASLTGAEALNWEDRPLNLGPLTVDPLRLRAEWSGRDLGLTVTEFLMLHSLVRRAGVVKTRDQLLQDAFPGRSADEGLVDASITAIRKKFEQQEPDFDALEGVHGAGYRYRAGPSVKRR